MNGFIADLSRYDPTEAVDPYDGVILNVEDPGFGEKRDRAIALGKPWGIYSWVYPGQGPAAAQRAHDAGPAPLGAWLDYEQAGVSPADLTAALGHGDSLGLKLGVYTYLYILPTVENDLGDHPLWLAYYPGSNDGTYQPWFSADARAHGALLHQFTSSEGRRDLNVVLDQARWSAWSNPVPAPQPSKEHDDMVLYRTRESGVETYYRDAGGILVKLASEEAGLYYGGMVAGWVHVVDLGGTLAALAFSANTVKAQRVTQSLAT